MYSIRILKENLPKESVNILDIGCGAGAIDFYLASKGNYTTGVDISHSAIKSCLATAKNLGMKNARFIQMSFPEEAPKEKYDVVILSEVIEHLKDDNLALQKIHSLLNNSGRLFLSTPSKNAPLHKLGMTRKFDKEVGHLRRYSSDELIKLLARTNFKVVKIYKTESVLRNFLFINPYAGKLIRFIKFSLVDVFNFIDNLLVHLFGESDIVVIAFKNPPPSRGRK